MHLGLLRDVAMERAHKVEEKDFQPENKSYATSCSRASFCPSDLACLC